MPPTCSPFSRLFCLFVVFCGPLRVLDCFSVSVKNAIGVLIGNAFTIWISWGNTDIVVKSILPIHECEMFFFFS